MQIRIFKDTETIRYAAEELAKYLGIMDSTIYTEIVVSDEVSNGAITLGILADLDPRQILTNLAAARSHSVKADVGLVIKKENGVTRLYSLLHS